jgi:uncharacterized protein
MTKTILIIHGAGTRAYRVMKDKWVSNLKRSLGSDYEVILPEMPLPQFPQYESWKSILKETISQIKGPLILVGHSLGGTVILKYLAEEGTPENLEGTFVVASPYFSATQGWDLEDFYFDGKLQNKVKNLPVFSYHSSDDKLVPPSHQVFIKGQLPHATFRTLAGHGHEFNKKDFTEIIEDIKNLSLAKLESDNRAH